MTKIKWLKLFVIALASFVASAAFLFNQVETQANSGGSSSPRSLYVQNCARCHGANGKAQTALGKQLEADDISGGISSAKVIRTVTNGRGDMPSFRKKLTAAQIKAVAAYVNSL